MEMRIVTKWLQEPSYHIVQWHMHSFASMGTVMLLNSLLQYLVSFLLLFLKLSCLVFFPPLLLKPRVQAKIASIWNCVLGNKLTTFCKTFWFITAVLFSGAKKGLAKKNKKKQTLFCFCLGKGTVETGYLPTEKLANC